MGKDLFNPGRCRTGHQRDAHRCKIPLEREILGRGKVDAIGVHAPCRGEDRLDHRAVMLGHDRRRARDLELGRPLDGEGAQLIAESLELNVLQILHTTFPYFVEQRLHLRLGKDCRPTISLGRPTRGCDEFLYARPRTRGLEVDTWDALLVRKLAEHLPELRHRDIERNGLKGLPNLFEHGRRGGAVLLRIELGELGGHRHRLAEFDHR
mmetsp:Transcript_36633/g.98121  ORF Transcript_36633/g.98121 Transcript_36633/m.98121 type:complete len:209 (-) Transcript_36633:915-1541(-)